MIPIVAAWMTSTAIFYAFACYFAFEYKRSEDCLRSPALRALKPGTTPGGFFKTTLLVAVVMILVLSAMVFILRRFPRIFDTINEAAVFFSFFVLPYTFRKKQTASSVATILFFAGEIVFATVATRYWETHPNWITNNICAFVVGIVILLTFRTVTNRQCAAVSLGIMAFDAFSVFVSGQMQRLVEATGDHAGTSIAIPAGLSPANPSVFSTGLGDLVVPGFVVLLAYRTYGKRGAAGAIAGYLAGMLVALVALLASDFPQPATIYLIPGAYFGFWVATARVRKRQLA